MLTTSCDPGSKIGYEILNKTTKPLDVKCQFVFAVDTAIKVTTVPANSTKMLCLEEKLGYVDDINKRTDSIQFYRFVVRQGSKILHKNLKDKKYWSFKRNNNLNATYILTVEDTMFNK